MEASFLDLVGDPVGLVVVFDDLVLDLLNPDKPRRDGLVDQRSVRPPAVGVGVIKVVLLNESALRLDESNEGVIGLLDVEALDGGDLVGEDTV